MNGILLLGAGGHARVVADILLSSGEEVAGFLDDDPATWGTTRLRLPVHGAIDGWAGHRPDGLIVAIGDNRVRQRLATYIGEAAELLWCSAIHPRATVASSVLLGPGTVVMADAVINTGSVIGAHAIIGSGAVIEHDCRIGDYAQVGSGCTLASGVALSEGALIGTGSTILSGATVGAWGIVGAGQVVVRDVPDGATANGGPARVTRASDPGR